MPADLKELRRLHEAYVTAKSQLQPGSIVGHFRADKALAYLNIAARNALPELLDRIEELEAENARLKVALERITAIDLKRNKDGSANLYSQGPFFDAHKIAREALEGR